MLPTPLRVCSKRWVHQLLFAAACGLSACGDESEPPTECAESCADGNPCTIDRCVDGECVVESAPEGIACSDDDACNGEEVCDGEGSCAAGEAIITNDGDVCTADGCDPATGMVSHVFEAGCVTWSPVATAGAPEARVRHTAVWTGSRMLVWGGSVLAAPPVTASGASYDPATDTWTPISEIGAPSARHSHTAVWTGSRMLVWGGYSTQFENTGGSYDPATDTWQPLSTVGAPSGRNLHAAVWTGDRLVVHGGLTNQSPLGDGASYDPDADAWQSLPAGGPSPRLSHSVVSTGDELIFLGGTNLFDWLSDGARFDLGGSWSPLDTSGGLSLREQHRAVWTGQRMIVWGGWNGGTYLDDGAIFDPAAPSWTPIATANAPSGRAEHVVLWTGDQMFVWGGCGVDACSDVFGDGALLRLVDGGGGAWGVLPSAGAPSPRRGATGVYSGTEAIIWGGRTDSGTFLATGARARLVE